MTETTYCVKRRRRNGRDSSIAAGIATMAEAAEVAYRLEKLQECELGGDDEFCAEAE